MPPAELQEALRTHFVAHPTKLWDKAWTRPVIVRTECKVPLWLSHGHKPVLWVDLHLSTTGASWKTPPLLTTGCTALAQLEATIDVRLQVTACRKLCEDGRLSEAVEALDVLVQQGCHVSNNLFYRVLKLCIQDKDLAMGRRIHALSVYGGYQGDPFLATHLIGLYASHGRLEEATGVFARVLTPDAFNWATLIFAYARHGDAAQAAEAIRLYRQMCKQSCIRPDNRLFTAVLKACATADDLVAGREVHAHILAHSGEPDRFVQAGLVSMYAKCGSIWDARTLFDKLLDRDVVTWTAMIAGYVQQGMGQEALLLYRNMQQQNLTHPNSVTYLCLLQACAAIGVGAHDEGKQLHADIKARGLQGNTVVAVSLVHMYAKCGSLQDARRLFETLSDRDVVTWTVLIVGYVQQGLAPEALDLYKTMLQEGLSVPDSVTYNCLLQACVSVGVEALDQGKQLHKEIQEQGLLEDVALGASLVNMYAKLGSFEDAQRLFDMLPEKNVLAWNAMLGVYVEHRMGGEALRLYRTMQQEGMVSSNFVTYLLVLQACAVVGLGALSEGRHLHKEIEDRGIELDLVVGSSLVNMYAKCGSFGCARRLFDNLPELNIVAWNAMIGGYAQQGMGQEALRLFRTMRQGGLITPTSGTFVCLLQACASMGLGALEEGKQLHAQIEEQNVVVDVALASSLVNMYVKCGRLQDARSLFDKLPVKSVVTWTVMIAGYAQHGMGQEALCVYSYMQQDGCTSPNSVTFGCLLQACASLGLGALDVGKQLHAQIEEQGLLEDGVVGVNLVNMYAKCCSLVDARLVFDRLPQKNVVTWNVMIGGCAQQGMGREALDLYSSMQQEGLTPDCFTYVSLLQACASIGLRALDTGKKLHAQIKENGFQENMVLGASLVNMYAKCCSLEDARYLFETLSRKNLVAWNAMVAGYAEQGMGQVALSLYRRMHQEGPTPDSVTFVSLLLACASRGPEAFCEGKQLHSQIKELGLEADVVLGGCLVNMYAKCGNLEDARGVFEKLPEKNLVAWNAIITGYGQQGLGQEALRLYRCMQQEGFTPPSSVTYLCLLRACASVGVEALGDGKQLHAQIEEQGLLEDEVLGVSLVNMYAKCCSLGDARLLFDKLPEKSVVAWTTIISGYAQQGNGEEALNLFSIMERGGLEPDSSMYVSLLQACASLGAGGLCKGKQLHAKIKEQGLLKDVALGGSLINMHVKCGNLEDARSVFESLPERNILTWNAMIAGYAQKGMGQEALNLYSRMQHEGLIPDTVTYVDLLLACAIVGSQALDLGKLMHAQIKEQGLEEEMCLGVSLVNMYAKCGSLKDARKLFDNLVRRNLIAWNAIIAGYARQGLIQAAFSLYRSMQQEGVTPDSVTYVCLLHACAAAGALPMGEMLHAEVEARGLETEGILGAALVNVYAKCGSMCDSQRIFDSLSRKSIEAWSALVGGYARQGRSQVVFDLLDRMMSEGVCPDEITLLSVLMVCSHVGLVDKGKKYFEAMRTDYGISPSLEHFICVVDLLGRAGHLDEALQMTKSMPLPPNVAVWRTLLSACRKWKNVDIGEQAWRGALSVDAKDAASYVVMSNIYASTQMWGAAKEMDVRRKNLRAWKKPGQSWCTDIGGVDHTFHVGDRKHFEYEGMYGLLELLYLRMKQERCVPHQDSYALNIPDNP